MHSAGGCTDILKPDATPIKVGVQSGGSDSNREVQGYFWRHIENRTSTWLAQMSYDARLAEKLAQKTINHSKSLKF